MKKLTKSYNKRISGVCGGIAEYFDLDPTVVRLGYLCLTIFAHCFPGLLLYIILAITMPKSDTKMIEN